MENLLGHKNVNGVERIESRGQIKPPIFEVHSHMQFGSLQKLGNTQKEILKEMLNGGSAYCIHREGGNSAHILLKDKTKRTVPASAILSLIARGLLTWGIDYKKVFITEKYRLAIELFFV